MATAWGAPDVIVERFIDEFGVVRPVDEFANCRRIAVRVVLDRYPYNYYVNSINRQPDNAFFGKITVFGDGYLRETHDITHEYCEFDLDTELLALNDAYIGLACRIILAASFIRLHFFALALSHPSIPGGLASIPDFPDYLNRDGGIELPDDQKRYPTRFVVYPRFDEIRVKFIEPQMRGKLILVGWTAVNKSTCCSDSSEEPDLPDEPPPKDPPLEAPPFRPDEPDSSLPEPTPPYDGDSDDGRTKPPPEEPPTGNECQLYQVAVTTRYFFSSGGGTYLQTDFGSIFGELGRIRILRGAGSLSDNVVIRSRGNNSNGDPCGETRDYPITGYTPSSGIKMDAIESVTVDGVPYTNF